MYYHHVLDKPDPFNTQEVTVGEFKRHLEFYQKYFNILSLSDALEMVKQNELPPRAMSITFDDGYYDNIKNALPLLLQKQVSATFFLVSDILENYLLWHDKIIESIRGVSIEKVQLETLQGREFRLGDLMAKRYAIENLIGYLKYKSSDEKKLVIAELLEKLKVDLPEKFMMNVSDVKQLVKEGMEIGAHTTYHNILTTINTDKAIAEIQSSKRNLEKVIGNKVNLFAYPNGKFNIDFNHTHMELVAQSGFKAAFNSQWGSIGKSSNYFNLPRFLPWHKSTIGNLITMLRAYGNE